MRIILFLVVLAPALSGCATLRRFNPMSPRTLEARRLTQEAEAAMHGASWDEAERKLVQAIDKSPDDTHARSVLADVLWQRGASRAAVEQKSRAVALSGRRDPIQLTELGQMEFSTGQMGSALKHANEAIAEDNMHSDAWTLRGFVLRAQGNPEESLNSFFRSLSIRSDDSSARLEIARIYHETGQPQRALAILGAVPHAEGAPCPEFAEVCYLRGVIMRQLGRSIDAIASLRTARENGCDADDLLVHLAESQFQAGEQLQARATLADAEKIPAGPEHRVAVSDLRRRIENYEINGTHQR